MPTVNTVEAELEKFVEFARLLGLTVEPFQRMILREVFAGRRELLVLIPRGNGKTSLFGLLALWHLVRHPEPRVYLAAAAKDQADLAFDVAKDFLRKSPLLQQRVKAQRRKLIRTDGAGFLKVISSDAGRQHGLIPTLALVDELHAHKNADLYVALQTALHKNPEAQLVTISTAGHDEEEALGLLRASAIEKGEITWPEPRLRVARIPASRFCMLEWANREDDDLTDPDVVKLSNPASFVTRKVLDEQIHAPGLHPVEFATYHANVWRSGVDSWLEYGAWDACAEDSPGIPPGADVFLGVDMGVRNDCGAIVAVHVRDRDVDSGQVADARTEANIYRPADQAEGVLAFSTIEQAVRDACSQWRVRGVAFDPWRFARSAELLQNEGVPMFEMPQSDERMVPATALLYEAIQRRHIHHDGDGLLAAHVNAGHAVPTARGIRLKKDPKAKKPVDALLALVMAFAHANDLDDGVSIYQSRGLL